MSKLMQSLRHNTAFVPAPAASLPSATVYLARGEHSYAVTLHAPGSPRFPDVPVAKPRRVYIPLAAAVDATEPRHLYYLALHKSVRWLDTTAASYWHKLVVQVCVPYRETHTAQLHDVAMRCRNTHGPEYYHTAAGRSYLTVQLAELGITCPPQPPALHYPGAA